MSKNIYIDLHIHSNHSVGEHTPSEIMDMAIENQTKIISLSDNDSISGLKEIQNNLKKGMIGVTGVELSTYLKLNSKRIYLHLLGYGFNEKNKKLQELMQQMKEKRINDHIVYLSEIKHKIHDMPYEEISKLDIERYCRFDKEIVKCFEKGNYSKEELNDLKEYIKENRFHYNKYYNINIKKAIDTIKSAGGYTILAHPLKYKMNKEDVEQLIEKLTTYGIDGIETYRADCNIYDSLWLLHQCSKFDLLNSAGSDFCSKDSADNRKIATGIDNSLCIVKTSLTEELVNNKQYFKRK